jgi:hypothetical protein
VAATGTYLQAGFGAVVRDVILDRCDPRSAEFVEARTLFVVVLASRTEAVEAREAGRVEADHAIWAVEQLDRGLIGERLPGCSSRSTQTPGQTVGSMF